MTNQTTAQPAVENPKLKPCPFCGGEAEFAVTKGSRGYPDVWDVCCAECDASTETFAEKERAVEQWNTRAAFDAVVEAANHMLYIFDRGLPATSIGARTCADLRAALKAVEELREGKQQP